MYKHHLLCIGPIICRPIHGWLVGWLVVFYIPSTARSFSDGPHLLSVVKDVKLGFNTIPGNRTPGRRMAVHYTDAVVGAA